MKSKLLSAKGIAIASVLTILFFGLSFTTLPQNKPSNKTEVEHTFLIKIPSSAGVCPYQLMMMTHGKLQMVHDPNCKVCPFEHSASFHNAVYMTARSTDVNSVRALLPACLKNMVQIKLQSAPDAKLPKNLFTSVVK